MVLMWKVQVLDSFVLTRMNNNGKAYRPCHFFLFEHRLPSNWLWSWPWSPDPPAPITLRLTHGEISDCAWIVRTCCFRSRQMINCMSIKEKRWLNTFSLSFWGSPVQQRQQLVCTEVEEISWEQGFHLGNKAEKWRALAEFSHHQVRLLHSCVKII